MKSNIILAHFIFLKALYTTIHMLPDGVSLADDSYLDSTYWTIAIKNAYKCSQTSNMSDTDLVQDYWITEFLLQCEWKEKMLFIRHEADLVLYPHLIAHLQGEKVYVIFFIYIKSLLNNFVCWQENKVIRRM